MSKDTEKVDQFLRELQHSRKDEVMRVRSIILAADPEITEKIKWNAPSFSYKGEDRITFRLQPGDRVQLVFHRGAKAGENEGFSFDEDSGLLEWITHERAVVTIRDQEDLDEIEGRLIEVVRRWVRAGSDSS